MIQLNYFHFSIFLFGWSNKKNSLSSFLDNFFKFNFFGPNLKIENRDQFAKTLRGQIIIYEKFVGSIWIFRKFEDQNAKFEKL